MKLLVSYRSQKDLICWPTLVELNSKKNIEVVTTLSREHAEDLGFLYGRIDTHMLNSFFADYTKQRTYMTCGPQAMMNLVEEVLSKNAIAKENIKTESFDD